MRYLFVTLSLMIVIAAAGMYLSARPVKCDDCNQGKKCNTSFDCGEIEVCYCQSNPEEEEGMGVCYFE
ncbi:MAG TPA: hypothetical protein VLG45_01500 [Thermodesulfobacteriota bacterium]|nr:hypothetical protein [Thermodesulfobacteriota bacterium]